MRSGSVSTMRGARRSPRARPALRRIGVHRSPEHSSAASASRAVGGTPRRFRHAEKSGTGQAASRIRRSHSRRRSRSARRARNSRRCRKSRRRSGRGSRRARAPARCAPARGGSNSTRVEGVEFVGAAAAAGRDRAPPPRSRASPRRVPRAAPQRRDGGGVGIGGEDFVRAGEPQREGAGAAEEIGDAPRALQRAATAPRGQRALARDRRLQKAARRRIARAPSPNATSGARRSITISP